jgi:AAA domain-containing protein
VPELGEGSTCLGGLECAQGDVLYLALEDNERRLQRRIEKLLGRAQEWPEAFHYATEWPRAAEGSEAIRAWLKRAKSPRLVVVDVLMMYRVSRRRRAQGVPMGVIAAQLGHASNLPDWGIAPSSTVGPDRRQA